MSDENTTIDSGVNGRTIYNVVVSAGKTYIINAVSGRTEFVVNGEFAPTPGGDAVAVSMTTAERTAITPDAGVLIWDTDLEKLFIGDGSTAGGVEVQGGGGSGTVTGIEASVSGGTATITATGSTTSVKLTGTGGVNVRGNTTTGAVELDAKDLSDGTQSVSKDLKQARWVPIGANEWGLSYNALTILHFSDIHADTAALSRILADANRLGEKIDDKICTGDMVYRIAGEISSWWDPSVLTVIGNHECATVYPFDMNWAALPMADRVAYYISPFESSWGTITRPSGKTWYYKDYTKQYLKIRLVVLDIQCYFNSGDPEGVAQTAWLQGVLSDAIPADRHVLIACHGPAPGARAVPCSFTVFDPPEAQNGVSNCPVDVVNAVASAISSGLKFCGYLCGHWHHDVIWDVLGDGTQYMYGITCAITSDPLQWQQDDLYRDDTLDAYNLVTIDPVRTRVRIIRGGGANVSNSMRKREMIEIDYSTGKIIDYERPRLEGDGRIEVNGIIIRDRRYIDTVAVTGETITMQAGRAFSADVAAAGTLTLNSEQVGTSAYGEVGLIDIHLGNAASVSVGQNIVLIDGFTSSARNICEVQFIDGLAIVKPLTVIADVISGYYVTLATGTGSGSLYYGLADSTEKEIFFDASTDGTPCDLGGVSVGTDKLITGNGIASTTISGAVNCGVYGTTVTALNLSGSTVTGGTMTILGAGAPGGTVQLGGFIEPRSVSGGVYDLSNHPTVASVASACFGATDENVNISGATICNGNNALACYFNGGAVVMTGCLITGNTESNTVENGVPIDGASCTITGCTFSQNHAGKSYSANGLHFAKGFSAIVSGCLFTSNTGPEGCNGNLVANTSACGPFAVRDCVFNGVSSNTFVGSAFMYFYGSGSEIEITGCTYSNAKVQQAAVLYTAGAHVTMSACVFSGVQGVTQGQAVLAAGENTSVTLLDCNITHNKAGYGAYGVNVISSAAAFLSNCTVVNNSSGTTTVMQDFRAFNGGKMSLSGSTVGRGVVYSGGTITLAGTNTVGEIFSASDTTGAVVISGGASVTLTSSIIPGGTGAITVLDGGCTVNGHSIAAGTYTSISSDGTTA